MKKELIENKEEIINIINDIIKNKKLIPTNWYQIGLLKKRIEHKTVMGIFPQFHRVIKIEKETLKKEI
jgi:adenylate kinase family enzyme